MIVDKLPQKQLEEWNRLVVKDKIPMKDRFKSIMEFLKEELTVTRRLLAKQGDAPITEHIGQAAATGRPDPGTNPGWRSEPPLGIDDSLMEVVHITTSQTLIP